MTWTAPPVERVDGPTRGDERTQLEAFLEFHRQTLLWKCAGLTAEQLTTASAPPSNLTLLGLLRHMTEVERTWFRRRVAGQDVAAVYRPDWNQRTEFDVAGVDAETDYGRYLSECEAARQVAAGLSLEHTFVHPGTGETHDLRWVYIHMIEEYARHNGHADLIRERIDGAIGE